jgi:peptidoglycan/xylan/chitin deacetylase (PgdA/CDA1 family)
VDSEEAWEKGYWREFADIEEANGLRSSWHVCSIHVPRWGHCLEELARRGHEIAWHGPRHDYRIAFMAPESLAATLAGNRSLFERFGMRGFRSPNYLRTAQLYEGLAGTFGYDSSTMDTAAEPLSPLQRTGCCTVFPFFRGDLLVLPLTVPDGLTIRCLTGDDAGAIHAVQSAKLEWIKSLGGLAFAITHPEEWISMRPGSLGAYRKLVERIAADPLAWKVLPRDIEAWWRRRAAGARG